MDPSALDGRSMGDPTLEEKAWEPSFEEGVLAMWKAEPDLYRFAPARGQSIYVIDTPPPYPSGSWHVGAVMAYSMIRSEEHTSELQSLTNLVCRLLLEKKKQ